MAEHKLVDGVQIELTAQEIAQRQAEATAWANGAFDRAIAGLRSRRNSILLLLTGQYYQTVHYLLK